MTPNYHVTTIAQSLSCLNISKLFEKLMYSRLYHFLDSFKCLYELQFGFRSNTSTNNHALISITEKIREAIDSGNFACGIFVDLQKAFDTVDHDILLSKLYHYGVRGNSYLWFKSYLSNRKQFVSINGFNSSSLAIKCGVPQGSILGPLLFLIYIQSGLEIRRESTSLTRAKTRAKHLTRLPVDSREIFLFFKL